MTKEHITAQEILSGLEGKRAWGLVRTIGSMFFLEMGESMLWPGEKTPHGEWSFLFQDCQWKFQNQGTTEVDSDDDQALIDQQFKSFDLGTVETIRLTKPDHDLRIMFDSFLSLQTSPAVEPLSGGEVQWCLYGPGKTVWIATPNGAILQEDTNEPL